MFEEIHFEKMYIIIGSICGYEFNNMCIVKGVSPDNTVEGSMKFTRSKYIMISHTNVIVSHSVFAIILKTVWSM